MKHALVWVIMFTSLHQPVPMPLDGCPFYGCKPMYDSWRECFPVAGKIQEFARLGNPGHDIKVWCVEPISA